MAELILCRTEFGSGDTHVLRWRSPCESIRTKRKDAFRNIMFTKHYDGSDHVLSSSKSVGNYVHFISRFERGYVPC